MSKRERPTSILPKQNYTLMAIHYFTVKNIPYLDLLFGG